MQRRMCQCGRDIWVQYRKGRFAVFWLMSIEFGRTVQCCPDCGRRLDIDELD
jgi:hypothetical protein